MWASAVLGDPFDELRRPGLPLTFDFQGGPVRPSRVVRVEDLDGFVREVAAPFLMP